MGLAPDTMKEASSRAKRVQPLWRARGGRSSRNMKANVAVHTIRAR
jgi:hypothetical protein